MVPPGGIRGGRPPMRGGVKPRSSPPAATVSHDKKRVLFVCIGNSCRSQMAEAFARTYGADVMIARSAGLNPATTIAPLTRQVLGERNIQLDGHFPKDLDGVVLEPFDIVVNMSGEKLPLAAARSIEWPVTDPIGQSEEVYRSVATQIEGLVMRLILELRSQPR
jgi:arsenate reductase (thioredoxin)